MAEDSTCEGGWTLRTQFVANEFVGSRPHGGLEICALLTCGSYSGRVRRKAGQTRIAETQPIITEQGGIDSQHEVEQYYVAISSRVT